jgi:hypothetical protein
MPPSPEAGPPSPKRAFPWHAVTRTGDVRPPGPEFAIILADAAERGFVTSVLVLPVKRGAGHPHHQ